MMKHRWPPLLGCATQVICTYLACCHISRLMHFLCFSWRLNGLGVWSTTYIYVINKEELFFKDMVTKGKMQEKISLLLKPLQTQLKDCNIKRKVMKTWIVQFSSTPISSFILFVEKPADLNIICHNNYRSKATGFQVWRAFYAKLQLLTR